MGLILANVRAPGPDDPRIEREDCVVTRQHGEDDGAVTPERIPMSMVEPSERPRRARRLARSPASGYYSSVPVTARKARRRRPPVVGCRAVLATDALRMLPRPPNQGSDQGSATPAKPRHRTPDHAHQFLEELPRIESVVRAICRRNGLVGDEAEDFASYVKAKLVADQYAVLRKFRGTASLPTYLTTVVVRLFQDFRIERWGKWRPSASAQRAGPWAIRLERLVVRDGSSWNEAVAIVSARDPQAPDERTMYTFLASLQDRINVRKTERLLADSLPAETNAEEDVEADEAESLRDRLVRALAASFTSLPAEDRVILRMRFWDDQSVAEIARALSLEQKPLYRRIETILRRLAVHLRAEGIGEEDVRRLLDDALPWDPESSWGDA